MPSALQDGTSPGRKLTWLQSTNQIPHATSANKGVSLTVASTAIARAPSLTPKALSANSTAYSAAISPMRAPGPASAGTRLATWVAKAAATPALEATLPIHISAPVMKPANGPNAVPT